MTQSTAGQYLEVEVKFLVTDLTAVRQRLLAAGARLLTPRQHEHNILYDTAEQRLRHHGQILRQRQDDQLRLTFKGPAPPEYLHSEAKVHEELEIRVGDDDGAQLGEILRRLGLAPSLVYEKYRETFQLDADGVEVVLDELPYGHFVELEGSEATIKLWAERLGLAWERRIQSNYLAMMGELQRRYGLPFQDITFANFAEQVAVDSTAVWGDALLPTNPPNPTDSTPEIPT